jgi:hypothetical protein
VQRIPGARPTEEGKRKDKEIDDNDDDDDDRRRSFSQSSDIQPPCRPPTRSPTLATFLTRSDDEKSRRCTRVLNRASLGSLYPFN